MTDGLETAANRDGLRRVAIDPVSRVEGHGKVTLLLDDANRVQQVRLHIVEFRGFEKFIEGRPYWEVPVMVQRLCGICPVSHHLAAAKARGARRFFVFGHKPAYTYAYLANTTTPAAGLDASPGTVAERDAFWSVIEQYNATYFAGHEHVFNVQRPRGGAYQILVGSGGSPFSEALIPAASMAVSEESTPHTDCAPALAAVMAKAPGLVLPTLRR